MKLYTTLLFLLATLSSIAQINIKGIVSDADSKEALIAASVLIITPEKKQRGTICDLDGQYTLSVTEKGIYTIEVSYTGYETVSLKDLYISRDTSIHFELTEGVELTEVVVTGYEVPLIEESSSMSFSMSKDRALSSPIATGTVSSDMAKKIAPSSSSGAIRSETLPEAGQLTAGEWKDLDNWGFWQKLRDKEEYQQWQEHWSFFPNERFSVRITNEQGRPVAECMVQLLDKDRTVVWTSKTDNLGKAELWANLFAESEEQEYHLNVIHQGRETTWRTLKRFTEAGVGHYAINTNCNTPETVDILFAVDATGSMGDELNYLKSELLDVIKRVQENQKELEFRLGSVFYRDSTDEYLTRASSFSTDIEQMVRFIQAQRAGGGGDYPEAVDAAMEEAVQMSWSTNARARLLFLLLDAPPHHSPKINARLQRTIQQAAKMGIKVIPITASGIHKDTEFLMKYMAVATNGTYVFLTDHSGIGNPHLEPTAEEYNVENLNDLLVRLIEENTEMVACQDWTPTIHQAIATDKKIEPLITKTSPIKKDKDLLKEVVVYPNPTDRFLFVSLQEKFNRLSVIASNGTLIWDYTDLELGTYTYNVEHLPSGTYYVRLEKEGKGISTPFIISRR